MDALFVPMLVLALEGICQTDQESNADGMLNITNVPVSNITVPLSNSTDAGVKNFGNCKLENLDLAAMLLSVVVLLPTCAVIGENSSL
jgi:hypothetical protein